MTMVLKFQQGSEYLLNDLLKYRVLGLTPQSFWYSKGCGTIIFISNKFPDGADADGPGAIFWELMCYKNSE